VLDSVWRNLSQWGKWSERRDSNCRQKNVGRKMKMPRFVAKSGDYHVSEPDISAITLLKARR
jgi:hypothetical protein